MNHVYVIHAPKDSPAYDRLASQARSANLSVEFDRMDTKHPWVPAWKAKTRTKVYKCEGAIVLISKNTSEGGLEWELECAQSFDIPMLGVHVDKHERGPVPKELRDSTVIEWDLAGITRFIQSLPKSATAP